MNMETITSVTNPLIQRLKRLKDGKERRETGQMLLEGAVMIREAIGSGLMPAMALITEDTPPELVEQMRLSGADIRPVLRHVLESVCDTKTPQGVCAVVPLPPKLCAEAAGARLVALDGVQDPGNVGTIWRTADAAGFGGLLLGEGCADATAPKVVRASMGSAFRLPAGACVPLAEALAEYRRRGYAVIVSALDGDDLYARAPLPEKFILVIGSEAHGVSAAVRAESTVQLKIPMRGGAESLNAAVAAGIMMYEIMR